MCICINCRHIHNCQTYWFIEQQHLKYENSLKAKKNGFTPINTLIKININKINNHTVVDWDLVECLSFVERPGHWLINAMTK